MSVSVIFHFSQYIIDSTVIIDTVLPKNKLIFLNKRRNQKKMHWNIVFINSLVANNSRGEDRGLPLSESLLSKLTFQTEFKIGPHDIDLKNRTIWVVISRSCRINQHNLLTSTQSDRIFRTHCCVFQRFVCLHTWLHNLIYFNIFFIYL